MQCLLVFDVLPTEPLEDPVWEQKLLCSTPWCYINFVTFNNWDAISESQWCGVGNSCNQSHAP